MKYVVQLTESANKEFFELTEYQQNRLLADFELISEDGIEFVVTRPLLDKILELKTDNIRSFFKYQKGQIIIVALIVIKKSQKTPKEVLKLAQKRLKEY